MHGVTEPPRGLAIIAGLTALTALRELRLPWCAVTASTALVPDSCAALLRVLCMPQLTTLRICTNCLRAVTSIPAKDRSLTLLGDEQWEWLEEQLKEQADVRIVVSSIQVIPTAHGWKKWGNLPHEQKKLFDLIRETKAGGVVFVSGDRHSGMLYELSKEDVKKDGIDLPYPMYELTGSGLSKYYAANGVASVKQGRDRQNSQLPRFFVSVPLQNHGTYNLDQEDSKHLMKVLRLSIGDSVELVDGTGKLQRAQVATVTKSSAAVSSSEPVRQVPWSGPKLELVAACGSLKGGRSDWLIEKATELGAFSVIPLLTANSAQLGSASAVQKCKSRSKGDGPQSGRLARWQRVATAGMKQSLRVHELHIAEPWGTDDLISCIEGGAQALIGAEGGSDIFTALHQILPTHDQPGPGGVVEEQGQQRRTLLVVGPEGDFTTAEQQALIAAGGHLVSLGPLRLRCETAAVALLSAAMLHASRMPAEQGERAR
eukprot:jgi/Ulvmu1/3792/UM018_0002.1